MRWRRMIALVLICGLLMSFTTVAKVAAMATATETAGVGHQPVKETALLSNQIPGNCSQVKCPQAESSLCPEDSYRLPSLVEPQKQTSYNPGGNCCPGSSTQKCQCIPDLLCAPKECSRGWAPHIIKNATGKPGECCPKFECFPTSEIDSTGERTGDVLHGEKHHYNPPEKLHGAPYRPSSSSDISFDSSDIGFDLDGGSSSIEDEDDDEDLEDENSSEDQLKTHLTPQHQKLMQHRILNDDTADDGHCFHEGKIYKSGESWTVQTECSECFCDRGLVSCKPISCDVPAECRLARAQPLSCCPVCDGCVSPSGKAYNMSETWQDDPCTNCTCHGGRIQCHVSMCKRQHSCENPKHYPGECCPRCENEPPDSGHPHPISPFQEKDSCPFRDCHRDISCINGFRLDKSGCPTCECQKCQSLLGCKVSCSKGFKVDNFGCTLCECRGSEDNNLIFSSSSSSRSRNENNEEANQREISSGSSTGFTTSDQSSPSSVKLDQRNLLGNPGNDNKDLIGRDGHDYHQYHDGNRYHRQHHQHPHRNEVDNGNDGDDGLYGFGYGSNEARSSSSLDSGRSVGSGASASAFVVLCTVDSDGVRRMEGEEWSDHCRRCVCRNGKEMCSLITCSQAPKCEHPIFFPSDCCPRCPVEETSVSFSQVNVSICLSTDGTERVEGEIWTLSSCLTCTCHSGQVLCAAPDCPPTPCSNPKLVDCCLQCATGEEEKDEQHTNSGSQSLLSDRNCLSDDSIKTYLDGETWKVGACQSCRCEDGKIQCFSAGKCPSLECSRPVLAKNQCCPICLTGKMVHKTSDQQQEHHGVEGFELHHTHGNRDKGGNFIGHEHHGQSSLNHGTVSTSTTSASRGPGGGLEPHCAVLIACLLVVTILLSLYIVRQVCFHRRVSRRLIKKVPVGFHSSSSSHSPSVTPDCCYKCDYSKYCDSGGCVIVGGGDGGSTNTSGVVSSGGSRSSGGGGCGGSSRASSTNGSNGRLSSEHKPLFQNSDHHFDHQSVSSSVIPNTPTPPPGLTQSLLSDSDKV